MDILHNEEPDLLLPAAHAMPPSGLADPLAVSNQSRLLTAFAGALGIDSDKVSDDLAYNSIPQWDSVAHMSFVTEVETLFGIMLDTNDIIDMSSYGAVRLILGKYGVKFED